METQFGDLSTQIGAHATEARNATARMHTRLDTVESEVSDVKTQIGMQQQSINVIRSDTSDIAGLWKDIKAIRRFVVWICGVMPVLLGLWQGYIWLIRHPLVTP